MAAIIRMAELDGQPSLDDRWSLIMAALGVGGDGYCYGCSSPWVVEIGVATCVVQRGEGYWLYPYTIADDGQSATLGVPKAGKMVWEEVNDPDVDVAAADLRAKRAEPGETLAFVTDLRGLQFAETPAGTVVQIEVCRDGVWQHPTFGEIRVNEGVRDSFISNFQGNVRKVGELPCDYDHDRGIAPGWITALRKDGSRLLADVRLTTSGEANVKGGNYRLFSPEFSRDWQDPETGERHGPTLFGGAFTNWPFLRGMAAIRCTEPISVGTAQNGQKEQTMATPGATPEPAATPVTGAEPADNTVQLADLERRLAASEERGIR